MKTETLLLEIGAEEIPAGYIEPALASLAENLKKRLATARISHGDARTFGTPRRLAVLIDNVATKQEAVTTDLMGPPENIAFDDHKNPTVAAEKFAEKAGVPLSEIEIRDTKKGRYLFAKKTEEIRDTITLLSGMLPGIILATPFPKTMRWANLPITFARPIHTVCALLGPEIIPFAVGNVQSGRNTIGHSFLHHEKIELCRPEEYVEKLTLADVIPDIDERRKIVEKGIHDAAKSVGGKILPDPDLLDINTNLVEQSIPVVGRFDDVFLDLPDEILITAMREHQKYFAVTDAEGRLMPCFVAVNNTRPKDLSLVAEGHGRVIRARLADARFFYQADVKIDMDDWVEKLKGVLFQAKLGTMHEKVLRVCRIVDVLSDRLMAADKVSGNFPEHARRAAMLSKADLVSEVVGEFPKLQGIMGRIYATVAGEPSAVADAVEDHYRPTQSGGKLPETPTGAVVSIADKIDSICGCFSVGLIPTGASDPYALRRQAIGILQIILDRDFPFSFHELIQAGMAQFPDSGDKDLKNRICRFMRARMEQLLVDGGHSRDAVTAVTNVKTDTLTRVRQRIRAVETLKSRDDFAPLAMGFKRVVNIIRKADDAEKTAPISTALFAHPSENTLFEAYLATDEKVKLDLASERFEEALKTISELKPAVDAFFDDVMVMTEDKKVRTNRLSLLGAVAGLFDHFADFSKLSG